MMYDDGILKTTHTFLKKRLYTLIKLCEKNENYVKFCAFDKRNNKHILCLFVSVGRIGKKFISNLEIKKKVHYIFICNSISFQAKFDLHRIQLSYEILSLDDIDFHKFKNKLIPEYKLLDKSEICKIKSCFGELENFPKLLVDIDPVAKYYNFQVGDLVSVERDDLCAFYRYCVNSKNIS